jgi:hypothetical protein
MGESEESKEEFKVSDKRRFTSEGQIKEEEAEPLAGASETEQAEKSTAEVDAEAETKADEARTESLPPMTFSTFVISLASTALFHMGLLRAPEDTGEVHKDLAGARQIVDILTILEEKTTGNLNDEEKKVLTDTLYQLRMAYIEASK